MSVQYKLILPHLKIPPTEPVIIQGPNISTTKLEQIYSTLSFLPLYSCGRLLLNFYVPLSCNKVLRTLLPLSFSFSLSHSLTHIHTHSLTHSPNITQSHSHYTHSHTHTYTHTLTHTLTHTFTHSLTHSPALTLALTPTPSPFSFYHHRYHTLRYTAASSTLHALIYRPRYYFLSSVDLGLLAFRLHH